jgi:hypothetical protein
LKSRIGSFWPDPCQETKSETNKGKSFAGFATGSLEVVLEMQASDHTQPPVHCRNILVIIL